MAVNVRCVSSPRGRRRYMPPGGRVITIGSCNAERMPLRAAPCTLASKAALVGLVAPGARSRPARHHH